MDARKALAVKLATGPKHINTPRGIRVDERLILEERSEPGRCIGKDQGFLQNQSVFPVNPVDRL